MDCLVPLSSLGSVDLEIAGGIHLDQSWHFVAWQVQEPGEKEALNDGQLETHYNVGLEQVAVL